MNDNKPYNFIEHLSGTVFPYNTKKRIMVMLSVYFDESFNQRTSKEPNLPLVYTVAGYLSSVQQWKAFQREWSKALKSVGIPYFHMTDFESRFGFYKDWSNEKRIHFLQLLHKIIHKYVLKGFAASIVVADYETMTDEQKNVFGDPYICAAISCMKHIGTLCDEFELAEPIAYVFESNKRYDGQLSSLFNSLPDEDRTAYRCGSLTFARKTCLPLQASDILAYEVTKEFARQLDSNNKRAMRLSVKNLAVSRIDDWHHLKKESFEKAITWLKENDLFSEEVEL